MTGYQVGDEIPGTSKVIYQRSLVEREFSEDSSHRDDYVQQKGYPGALVSAYVLTGYMSEPLVNFFGASWFTTGSYELAFVGTGVQLNDAVRCRGRIIDITPEADGVRVELDVWMERQAADRPVVGRASGFLPGGTREGGGRRDDDVG